MRELSLFSGGGGAAWTGKLLGWQTVGYVESCKKCRELISSRIEDGVFDDAPIFEDVRTFNGSVYCGKVDLVTAGFPCQPFSAAGKRRGADDERNLWPETIRIIREVRPRFAFLENVPALLSSGYFGSILRDLAEIGFNAEWCVLSAAECGALHIRKRLWILAHTNSQREQQSREYETQNEVRQWPGDRGWWSTEPELGRVAHGVADRRHRLKCLGNGWVPQVAARAWEELKRRTDDQG